MSDNSKTLHKMQALVFALNRVVTEHLSNFQPSEIQFVIKNYGKHLKLDLSRDFQDALKQAPADGVTLESILKDPLP